MWWWFVAGVVAHGGEAPPDADGSAEASSEAPVADVAEYQRLTQEIERLARRNAWPGVERLFDDLVATGVAPSFDDWVRGAYGARAVGNVAAERQRLLHAKALREDPEVFNWLYEIDSSYGDVKLTCDADSHILLEREVMPFDPLQRRAVEYAQAQIASECAFEGLLPFGTYRFFRTEIEVGPVQSEQRDLRGLELDRKTRKELEKAWKAAAASSGS